MGLGEMIFNWFFGFATIGGVILAIIVASYLRDKYNKKIGPHWENAIIPSIAFLLTHLTVWWMWPKYWTPFYMSNGFMLLQVMAVFGIYAISLSNKPAKAIGKALVYVAVAGLLVNVWGVYRTLHPTAPTPPPTVTNVTRGHWSNYVTDKNRGVADEVVVFFRSELPPADADLMTQICYEESRFRQFEEDGVTPLHGKVNPADTGVCQINMAVWKEELDQLGPEFNPDSLEGSLNAALWIFRKEGADKWVTYPKALYVLRNEIPARKEIVRVAKTEPPKTEEECKVTRVTAPIEGWEHVDVRDKRVSLNIEGPIRLDSGKGDILTLDVHPVYDVTWKSDYIEIQARSLRYDGTPNPTPSIVTLHLCST